MFTGIVEDIATVVERNQEGTNIDFILRSEIANQLKIDQSLSHNGVCLTVVETSGDTYKVTAIQETLDKSNLGTLEIDDQVNIERCMVMNGRIDGHIVQGHVDTTTKCLSITDMGGSWVFRFGYSAEFGSLLIPKGSISINGVSLTIAELSEDSFTVAIIPYTYHHTNFCELEKGDPVNLEFDMIGKYILRQFDLKNRIPL